jgi:ketosteroid isomerase-like protein
MLARRLAGLLAIGALAAAPGRAQNAPDAVRAELLALEARWDSAVVRKDVAVLERILDPAFVFIGADGAVSSREGILAGLQDPDLVIDPFETRDVLVRVYGGTAVLTGWYEQTGRYSGQAYRSRMRYTDVYVRDAGRWIAVSAHASRLADPVPPAQRR